MTTSMFEAISDSIEDAVDKLQGKFYGVVTGKVINLLDPMSLGRVQVQLPFIDSIDLSPWARIALPMAGYGHGSYFIPNIGDEVLVAFEHGDVSSPYIIGSLWNAMAPPPLLSPIPQIRANRTLAGNQVVFSEIPPTVTIQNGPTPFGVLPTPPSPTGPHQTVTLKPAGVQIFATSVQIVSGTNVINMTPDGITISSSKNLNLIASGIINMAGSAININGGSQVSVMGTLVKIN
jgi:hypothetical protein